jgi:single-strand DNA-binding protein
MSLSVNQVVLVGRLTADPHTRELPDGKSVCELRLAVNDHKDDPAMFIDITTFGKQADACATHLTKGREIAVNGRLAYNEWVTKTGERRSKHHIIGRITFGNGRNHVPTGE